MIFPLPALTVACIRTCSELVRTMYSPSVRHVFSASNRNVLAESREWSGKRVYSLITSVRTPEEEVTRHSLRCLMFEIQECERLAVKTYGRSGPLATDLTVSCPSRGAVELAPPTLCIYYELHLPPLYYGILSPDNHAMDHKWRERRQIQQPAPNISRLCYLVLMADSGRPDAKMASGAR
eukprot:6211745-Pleurochrysis_carterae.AAC.4